MENLATRIEYSNMKSVDDILNNTPNTHIGYLSTPPLDSLRALLPIAQVVEYREVNIPIGGKHTYLTGLCLFAMPAGKGISGTIEELCKDHLFQESTRNPISQEQRDRIAERLRRDIQTGADSVLSPYSPEDDRAYLEIFDALGHPLSRDELEKLKPPIDMSPKLRRIDAWDVLPPNDFPGLKYVTN